MTHQVYLHTTETRLVLQVKKDLERHEGFREYAYPDPLSPMARKYKGKDWPWGFVPARTLMARIKDAKDSDGAPWTYGFGFTYGVTPDSRITRILAERKLEALILNQDDTLAAALPWYSKGASFVTKTVLINMAFNLGLKGLLGFKNTLNFVKLKDYEKAARNMMLSLWYTQTGSRAKELALRMKTQTIEPLHKARETING